MRNLLKDINKTFVINIVLLKSNNPIIYEIIHAEAI